MPSARPPQPSARAYHHGDLRPALLRAAEDILIERGVEGFTLREAARRAGVSPAAPAHHFGDARGLLTAVSTLAFEELARRLGEANRAGGSASDRLSAQGRAYVAFALDRPALFDLMFRSGRVETEDPVLCVASDAAFTVLLNGVVATLAERGEPAAPAAAMSGAVAAWSLVHGFARLALDGRLGWIAEGGPDALAGLLDDALARLDLLAARSPA